MHAHKIPRVFSCSEKMKYFDCSAGFKIYVLNYQSVVPNDLQRCLNYTQKLNVCVPPPFVTRGICFFYKLEYYLDPNPHCIKLLC